MGIIRLILALSVVATHCGAFFDLRLVGGKVAVQAFYIISGFYMSLILNEKYIGQNASYKLFLSNRFLRLFPIYWVILILTVLAYVYVHFNPDSGVESVFANYAYLQTNILSFAFLGLSNLFIFGQDIVMYLGVSADNGALFFTKNFHETSPQLYTFLFLPQAWTLGIELSFYLVAPYILRRGIKPVILIIAASFALRLILMYGLGLDKDPWTHRFFPTELMFFLFGYLSYIMYKRVKANPVSKEISLGTLALVLVSTLAFQFAPGLRLPFVPFSLKEIYYFTLITFAIPILFNYFKSNKLDYKIGEWSYPVYISHMFVFLMVKLSGITFLNNGIAVAVLSILLSIVLIRFVADPIEKLRQSRIK
jgi:peptidoglycan/LPS O-acetylase OafA/YrhL